MAQNLLKFSIVRRLNYNLPAALQRSIGLSCQRTSESKNGDMVDFDDSKMLPIPIYEMKHGETLERQKARLCYQSRKRGMLENGLLLSTFAAKYLDSLNPEQTHQYDRLINLPSNDWDIYYWATGVRPTPDEYNNEIMKMFKNHVVNGEREQRFAQPDLIPKPQKVEDKLVI